MITIEKDSNAEEMFIHATPEDLREFAKKLWALSEKADAKGVHKEQFTIKDELSATLKGEPHKHSVIKKLSIHCRTD